ncbi:hypothetical protein BDN72DRAFT_906462, partial [Pluteus cervinus]
MDLLYNVKEAYDVLEDAQRHDEREHLHDIMKKPDWQSRYCLAYHNSPSAWRFVDVDGSAGFDCAREMIFTLQGVVEAKELPPVTTDPKIPRNKYIYLQQSVTLTGLGTPIFEQTVQALAEVATTFNRQFPEGQMIPWHSSPSCLAGGQ